MKVLSIVFMLCGLVCLAITQEAEVIEITTVSASDAAAVDEGIVAITTTPESDVAPTDTAANTGTASDVPADTTNVETTTPATENVAEGADGSGSTTTADTAAAVESTTSAASTTTTDVGGAPTESSVNDTGATEKNKNETLTGASGIIYQKDDSHRDESSSASDVLLVKGSQHSTTDASSEISTTNSSTDLPSAHRPKWWHMSGSMWGLMTFLVCLGVMVGVMAGFARWGRARSSGRNVSRA